MKQFLNSGRHALDGLRDTFRTERNFRVHLVATLIAIAAGFWLELSTTAWGLLLFAIGFVLTAELFNTALERLSDEVAGGKQNPLIRQAKDVSAAAVLVSAVIALAIGFIFIIIPIIKRIF